ncbi:hypothetical protein B0I12_002573 [Microbacterium hydrothermale]|uniref:hypothetical protein n=1 Tax=Microbacterium hydrothermale TaxID=857427 RepID=UPI002226528E|nr:hypothetical protein [Microbacterium hydrothermale]MCW2165418.1 hypothetical protein [Microbacterium hydrothermale]
MSLPSGVTKIGNMRGPVGPAGSVSAGDFVSIPAGEQGKVVTRKVGEITLLDVYQPRGLPGVNAVPADNAVATYSTAQGSATNTALRSFLLPRAEVASTIAPLIDTAGPVRDALRAQFTRASILGVGANTAPLLEWTGIAGAFAGMHLSNGPGFTGPYMAGFGNDFGNTTAVHIANKAGGVGLYLDNHPTATGTGMFAAQRSDAPLFDFVTAKNAAGTMMVLRVDSNVTNPGSLAAFYGKSNVPILELHGNGGLGFFGKTPTGRQPRIPFTSTDAASLQDTVNKIIGTLIEYGLIPANT